MVGFGLPNFLGEKGQREAGVQNFQQQQPVNARVTQHSTICFCLPLRTAVFVNALGTVVLSILLFFFREVMDDGMRVFTGGYSLQGRVAVDLIEISGCLWGVIGIIGAVYLKTSYVRIYMYYQVARLFAWGVMYLTDVPLLWACELWMTDLELAAKLYGWNHIMYNLAVNSRCQEERFLFTTLSTLCLIFFVQLTWASQKLLNDLEEEPKYLLTLPKNTPNGAFYTQSLASRSLLAQQKEQRDRAADRNPGSAPPGGQMAMMNQWVGPPTGVTTMPGFGTAPMVGGIPPGGTGEFGPQSGFYGATAPMGPSFAPAPAGQPGQPPWGSSQPVFRQDQPMYFDNAAGRPP